jgi:hypothetical protein
MELSGDSIQKSSPMPRGSDSFIGFYPATNAEASSKEDYNSANSPIKPPPIPTFKNGDTKPSPLPPRKYAPLEGSLPGLDGHGDDDFRGYSFGWNHPAGLPALPPLLELSNSSYPLELSYKSPAKQEVKSRKTGRGVSKMSDWTIAMKKYTSNQLC